MLKKIVNSWTEIPFIGVQIRGYNSAQSAFEYAEKEPTR